MKNIFSKKYKNVLFNKRTQGIDNTLSLAFVFGKICRLKSQIGSTPRARQLSRFVILTQFCSRFFQVFSRTRTRGSVSARTQARVHVRAGTGAMIAAAILVSAGVIGIVGRTSQPAAAAPADTLNFQGRLLTNAGSRVPDGTYHIEFKLYDTLTSTGSSQGSCTGDANCLWTETRSTGNLVTVQNGYFSVYLGDVTALPNIDWSQALYLGMNIGGASGSPSWDGEMSPRFKLTAVPYAFRAANVASGDTNAVSSDTNDVNVTTGDALGATSDSGSIGIDVGTATGTTGTISLGAANASALTIGNSAGAASIIGSSASSFVLNGTTVSAAEFNVLDNGIEAGDLTTQGTATDEYCLTYETGGGALLEWQVCGGGGGGVSDLQGAYNGSTNPEIVVDGTRGALTVRDNSTPIGANLLEVQNNAGTATYFSVAAAGTTVTGPSGGSSAALTVNTGAANNVGLAISGAASQTFNFIEVNPDSLGYSTFTHTASGNTTLRPASDSGSTFIVTNAAGTSTLLNVNSTTSTVSTDGALLVAGSTTTGTLKVAVAGSLLPYTTPGSATVYAAGVIDNWDYGTAQQALVVGVDSGAAYDSRGIIVFDARTSTDNQQSIGVFSPDESDILGFSWEGANGTGYVKTLTGSVGLRVGSTDSATFSATAISLLQNTTASGTFTANGNTTIGDANTDTLTINAGSAGSGISFGDSSFANCSALSTVSGVLSCGTSGGSLTLQDSYDNDANGSNAVIALTSTDGALVVRDAASTIGTLFTVEANGGADYLNVASSGTTVTGPSGGSQTALTVNTGAATNDGLVISGAAGQSGALFAIQADSTAYNIFNVDYYGRTFIRPAVDAGDAFNITNAAGTVGVLGVDTGTNLVSAGGALYVEDSADVEALNFHGTGTLNFTTPQSSSVTTKINIPLFNPGASNQILALGLPSGAATNSRAISLFDNRAAADNQPVLSVFSPDESDVFGLSSDGSNSYGYLKATSGLGLGVKSGSTVAATFETSGNTTLNFDLAVNGGDIDASGVALNIGTTSATGVTVGRAGQASTLQGSSIALNSGTISTNQTTVALLNSTPTTVNAFGAATTLSLGADTGTTSINNGVTLGSSTADLITVNGILQGGNPLVFEGSSADANETTFTITNPTVDQTITFPNATGTVLLETSGSSTAGVSGFVQGGNTWATTATLGTNDANSLVLETNNQSALTIASGGAANFQNATNSTAALTVKTSAGSSVLAVDTTTRNVCINCTTTTAAFSVNGVDDEVQLRVKADAAQTAIVFEVIDGSSNNLLSVAANGLTTVENDLVVKGGDLTSNAGTFNLLNTTPTTINAFGAATATVLGATTGTTSIRNTLQVGTSSTTNGTVKLLNSTNAFGVTISASGQTAGDATIAIPNTAGVGDTFCLLTLANCSGSGGANEFTAVVGTSVDSSNVAAADYVADGNTGTAGDGDQMEINAAIDAVSAAGGGKVLLLEGTYTIDATIDVDDDVEIVGSGQGATIITIPNSLNTTTSFFSEDSNPDNWAIRDLTINMNSNGNQTAGNYTGIDMRGASASAGRGGLIENVEILDFTRSQDAGIYLLDTYNTAIRGNRIYNGEFAIYIEGDGSTPQNINVTDNYIQDIDSLGIYATDSVSINISNNTVMSHDGVGTDNAAIELQGAEAVSITDNIIMYGTGYGIRAIGSVTDTSVKGNRIEHMTRHGIYGTFGYSDITNNDIWDTDTANVDATTYGQLVITGAAYTTVANNNIAGSASSDVGIRFESDQGSPVDSVIANNVIGLHTTVGIYLETGSDRNIITGNSIYDNDTNGIFVTGSNYNLIQNNSLYDNGANSSADGIAIAGNSDFNQLIGNRITDTGTGTGQAIDLQASTVDNTYLADNTFSGTGASTINDSGTGTIYANQQSTTGNLVVKTATTGSLTLDTGTTGTIDLGTGTSGKTINIGTGAAAANTIALGGTGANVINIGNTQAGGSINLGAAMTTGTITIGGTGAQTGTIALGTGTGAQTINLGTGGTGAKTVTLGSSASTSSTLIQAGTGNITLQVVDSSTIGVVKIGAGGAGTATPDFLALDVKSTTGDPAGGAEGYIYYNTFDNKFRCYQNSGWTDCIGSGGTVADEFTAVVGRSGGTNPSTNVAAADYVADGTSDEDEINSAITAANTAGGGKVLLLEGTYFIDGTVDIKSNVELVGSGVGATIIKIADSTNASMFVISESTNPSNFTIRDLSIDANDTNNTGTQGGIAILTAGSDSGATSARGPLIENVEIHDLSDNGIYFDDVNYGTIADSHIYDGTTYGIWLDSSDVKRGNIVRNNQVHDISNTAVVISDAPGTVVSGNTIKNSGISGLMLSSSNGVSAGDNYIYNSSYAGIEIYGGQISVTGNHINTSDVGIYGEGIGWASITGNDIGETTTAGISIEELYYSNVTGNTIYNSAGNGVELSTNTGTNPENTISGNNISSIDGKGILLTTSAQNNVVTGNNINTIGLEGIDTAGADYTLITDNTIYNFATITAGSDGIAVTGDSDNNSIISNRITDGGSGEAIDIGASANNTYVGDNQFSGAGADDINDGGTGTIFASQFDGNGDQNFGTADGTAWFRSDQILLGQNGASQIAGAGSAGFSVLSDDLNGATGTLTVRSGNSSVSGNTGALTIKSGDATSGNSGNISVDVGNASGTKGTISIGNTYASSIAVGHTGITSTFTGLATFVGDSSTTAFQVQTAAGADVVLAADTTNNRLKIGNSTGTGTATSLLVLDSAASGTPTGVAGAMYYDSAANKFKCYTTSWVDCDTTGGGGGGGTVKEIINAEYAGVTLHADGTNNSGTLTSDYDSTNRRNYYDWTTTQSSLQDYELVVQTHIPSDYSSGFGTFKIWALGASTSSANNDIQVTVLDASGTTCASSTSVLPGSASTWTEQTVTLSGCSYAANDILTITVKVFSKSSNNVRIGSISYQYTN